MKKKADLLKFIEISKLGFEKEPMDDLYQNPIGGFLSRFRVKRILEELCATSAGKTVADVGSEAGYISMKMTSKVEFVIPLDPCLEALKLLKKSAIKQGNLLGPLLSSGHYLPLKSRSVDVVVCSEVLQLAPYLEKMLREFGRVIKRGGKLILTFPNENLKKRFYPIASWFGVNTKFQKELTPFHYSVEDVKEALPVGLEIEMFSLLPHRLLPLTNFVVCKNAV